MRELRWRSVVVLCSTALCLGLRQQGTPCVNTVAGTNATRAFMNPRYMALDSNGVIVFSAGDNFTYRLVDDGETVYAIAGTADAGRGPAAPGASIRLANPQGIALFPAGTLFEGSIVIVDSSK